MDVERAVSDGALAHRRALRQPADCSFKRPVGTSRVRRHHTATLICPRRTRRRAVTKQAHRVSPITRSGARRGGTIQVHWLMRLPEAPHEDESVGRRTEPMRSAKAEGKIKGSARVRPETQSARGVGAARHLAMSVPRKSGFPHLARVGHVPRPTGCAAVRWSSSHGFA